MSDSNCIPMAFARFDRQGVIPQWAASMNAERLSVTALGSTEQLSGVLVLEADQPDDLERYRSAVNLLSAKVFSSTEPVEMVMYFGGITKPGTHNAVSDYLKVHQYFSPVKRLEVVFGEDLLRERVLEAMAKWLAAREERGKKDDPLAGALEIRKSRAALASDTGRLDASKVADSLGMSVAKLAGLLGKSRATVSKTPDARGLQEGLLPFERILRLQARLPQDKLLAWLETPNRHLDEMTPRKLIEDGRAGVVADLVEDALTGQPT